ncbi:MAG: GAF domain-containing protein [Actinoplanes sp.]
MTLPPAPDPPTPGGLADAMVTLAGSPDHSPRVDTLLGIIARLTVDLIAPARFASITALRGETFTTVAVNDDLIKAVDEAQYVDNAGPCLEALVSGAPVGVPAIDTTVQWPSFHETAPRLGLHASASVPLFAGRGEPIAALNVYSPDRFAMEPLIAGIRAVHGHPSEPIRYEEHLAMLDPGGRELITGYAEALSIRATIRLALEMIKAGHRCSATDAYLSLCLRAGDAGTNLAEAAATLIREDG